MSPPSPSSIGRRVPVQQRSERRVANFLGHAAVLIAEVGYEAATMTEIAGRAGASIGAVYQYFPNKEAIVRALRAQYGEEMESRWALLETDLAELDPAALSIRILNLMVEFSEQRPAFFALLNAPVSIQSDSPVRQRIKERFARMFRMKNPILSKDESLRMADVTIQTIKGLNSLCGEAKSKDRRSIELEFQALLVGYLRNRLEPTQGHDAAFVLADPLKRGLSS